MFKRKRTDKCTRHILNTHLIVEKRIRGGFFVHAHSDSSEILSVDVNKFNNLHIHANARTRALGVTYDGSIYQFGRTFGENKPCCKSYLNEGSQEVLPSYCFEISDGFFYFLQHPYPLYKPGRLRELTLDDTYAHTIYLIGQEERFARRIEEMLYYIGLDEGEAIGVKPYLLQGIGLEDYERLGRQQLSLEDTFKHILSYEKLMFAPSSTPILYDFDEEYEQGDCN